MRSSSFEIFIALPDKLAAKHIAEVLFKLGLSRYSKKYLKEISKDSFAN
jgi:hypothetical protein